MEAQQPLSFRKERAEAVKTFQNEMDNVMSTYIRGLIQISAVVGYSNGYKAAGRGPLFTDDLVVNFDEKQYLIDNHLVENLMKSVAADMKEKVNIFVNASRTRRATTGKLNNMSFVKREFIEFVIAITVNGNEPGLGTDNPGCAGSRPIQDVLKFVQNAVDTDYPAAAGQNTMSTLLYMYFFINKLAVDSKHFEVSPTRTPALYELGFDKARRVYIWNYIYNDEGKVIPNHAIFEIGEDGLPLMDEDDESKETCLTTMVDINGDEHNVKAYKWKLKDEFRTIEPIKSCVMKNLEDINVMVVYLGSVTQLVSRFRYKKADIKDKALIATLATWQKDAEDDLALINFAKARYNFIIKPLMVHANDALKMYNANINDKEVSDKMYQTYIELTDLVDHAREELYFPRDTTSELVAEVNAKLGSTC